MKKKICWFKKIISFSPLVIGFFLCLSVFAKPAMGEECERGEPNCVKRRLFLILQPNEDYSKGTHPVYFTGVPNKTRYLNIIDSVGSEANKDYIETGIGDDRKQFSFGLDDFSSDKELLRRFNPSYVTTVLQPPDSLLNQSGHIL